MTSQNVTVDAIMNGKCKSSKQGQVPSSKKIIKHKYVSGLEDNEKIIYRRTTLAGVSPGRGLKAEDRVV